MLLTYIHLLHNRLILLFFTLFVDVFHGFEYSIDLSYDSEYFTAVAVIIRNISFDLFFFLVQNNITRYNDE